MATSRLVLWLVTVLAIASHSNDVNALAQSSPAPSLQTPSELIMDSSGRLRGIRSSTASDFVLGAVIPIHDSAENSSGMLCGTDLTFQGVQRVETILYVLDQINGDPAILPNITIGYDIRDTCRSPNIAIDEALDITLSGEAKPETCLASNSSTNAPSEGEPFLVGVIGAEPSGVSVAIANLFRQFMVTQISYLSTSPLLNDRNHYTYFLRVVPSDNIQAAAMFEFVTMLNWTLVSTVHSDDAYGSFGIEEFKKISAQNGNRVCVDYSGVLKASFKSEDFRRVAVELLSESSERTNVVILFSATNLAKSFLSAVANVQQTRKFIWIVSDSLVNADIAEYYNVLTETYGFHPSSAVYKPFEDQFIKTTISNNQRDLIWYTEYCETILEGDCTGNFSVASHPSYLEDAAGSLVVDAVYSLAIGLDRFLKENCQHPVTWNKTTQTCVGQKKSLTRSTLLNYIQDSNFTSPTNSEVSFDSNGQREGKYSIFTIQQVGNDIDYVEVATYNPITRTLDISSMTPPTLESSCKSCYPGFIYIPVEGSCCDICQPCLHNQTTSNETDPPTKCTTCQFRYWGNDPLNGNSFCQLLPDSYLKPSDAWGAIIISLSAIGLLATLILCVLFGIFWNNPLIKVIGYDLVVMLLLALFFSFVAPILHVIHPSIFICLVKRSSIWLCVPLILVSLLVKEMSFVRKDNNEIFSKTLYRVVVCLIIWAGGAILAVVSLISVHPDSVFVLIDDNISATPVLEVRCKETHLIILVLLVIYNSLIVLLTIGLSIYTMRHKGDYKATRIIGATAIVSSVVWLAFIPSVFITRHSTYQSGVLATTILLVAYVVLVLIFGPLVILLMQYHILDTKRKKYKVQSDKSQEQKDFIDHILTENSSSL